MKLFDGVRFMGMSLSTLVLILVEAIHEIKYKYRHDEKREKCKTVYKVASAVLNTQTL